MSVFLRSLPAAGLALLACLAPLGAAVSPAPERPTADYVPAIASLVGPQGSELRDLVERFVTDRGELARFYDVPGSAVQQRRFEEFYQAWQTRLAGLDWSHLGVEGRIDATLLRTRLNHEIQLVNREARRTAEMAPLLPFAEAVAALQTAHRYLQPVNPAGAAAALDQMRRAVEGAHAALLRGLAPGSEPAKGEGKEGGPILQTTPVIALRAANRLGELKHSLAEWFDTYDGYDPSFSWWNRDPYQKLSASLDEYGRFLREKIVGIDPKGGDEPIIGDPIGREGLAEELASEMIPYRPEELVAIAEREFGWVEGELRRAAREMGCGDDWKAALEKVKEDHVDPGQQPALVRDLALEAIRFVTERQLVTVPPLAADGWQVRMMSPSQQKVAPFFLGGSDILVAFPTEAMSQEEKVQSLRANNRHFARATVFHELIPGHHLQFYAKDRFNQHRELFRTPFWMEGWAVWWEFHFWDLHFITTPEDRIGALFWRAHRCARIIFSLKFHLGEWTPQQCIDFLVERVGHERASATGEVRRSFNGQWSPLYQAGYMLGAMQLRGLYQQLVASGQMSERDFHDQILRGNAMPIEMVRARLMQVKLTPDFRPNWRFAD